MRKNNPWMARCAEMAGRGNIVKSGRMPVGASKKEWDVDWLACAIGTLGGPDLAAGRLGVSSSQVYKWLVRGLGTLDFRRVIQISNESGVPLHLLAQRLESYSYPDGR